ncbi:MAG: hypothetical protein DKM50_03500 [Candidatus Margulisiibacteriota bacterium]|nr:MAG: hypothetical protein A2X43_12625 [Candidatus Margulisbacteria bacterium GWD2_39_127]OGI02850.1 MAG: hypothetical protein A2X42_02125 [Candidatus Margulisbacteria bacterium GWF2_38_17]OGI09631.1 MAG: hypothetical protein A2X41_04835 [Candidatus Margulisbacteria bacterium GWE2_39_32]PZM83043.1 MAG: hypothetical protein DKM50_03500 [Candidatus Margulisiibacteriota bacterium]HAR63661.1 hypothetical protein [Candidatus Margulisiibacteriota bacterium]
MNKKNRTKTFSFVLLLLLIFGLMGFDLITRSDAVEAATPNQVLRFVQLTDVHIDLRDKPSGKRLLSQSRGLLANAVATINSMNVDFAVFSGDSINSPREKSLTSFAQIASQLNCPWYVALGNHDIAVYGSLTKGKFFELLNQVNRFQKNTSPYYSFVPKKGYLIVVMDGVIDSRATAHGNFDRQQLNWLEEQLTNNRDSKVIIVQHFPLIEPTKSYDHDVVNKKEYLDLLNKYSNVVAVLSGHYHAEKVRKVGSITHISTPALVEFPSRFRVITITDNNNQLKLDTELVSVTVNVY